jgi:hypothetical protein
VRRERSTVHKANPAESVALAHDGLEQKLIAQASRCSSYQPAASSSASASARSTTFAASLQPRGEPVPRHLIWDGYDRS